VNWEYNCWSGNSHLRVSDNERIKRVPVRKGTAYLYYAEYWGDYSLDFPVMGRGRDTLAQAKRDLKTLKQKTKKERSDV